MGDNYKRCSACGKEWAEYKDLILDPEVRLNGYQAALHDPEAGLILLTHEVKGCGSTIGLAVRELSGLYEVERFPYLKYDTDLCTGKCQNASSIELCDVECSMSWVRQILVFIKNRVVPPGDLAGAEFADETH